MSNITVKELIAALKGVDGTMPVRLWCDHGQVSMGASTTGIKYSSKAESTAWMSEDIHDDKEYTSDVPHFEIGSP